MALVQLPSELWFPHTAFGGSNLPTMQAGSVLDVVGDSLAVIFQVSDRSDGKTINKLGVNVRTVTAAGDVDARVETVDPANGDPSGTLATVNSNKSQAVAGTGWTEFTLTAGHTVAAGDLLAAVFVAAATTNITMNETRRMPLGAYAVPYMDELIDPAGWVKATLISANKPTIAVGFSDGSWEYIPGSEPVVTIGTDDVVSTGAAEVGIEFQIPFAATLSGVTVQINRAADLAIHIGNSSYLPGESGATRLSTIAIDKDINSTTAYNLNSFRLSTPIDLAANTTYRAVIEETIGANLSLVSWTVDANALLPTLGVPISWRHIIDNEAGGWTTTTTKLPGMSLGFTKIDDGAGGGGGGMRYLLGG